MSVCDCVHAQDEMEARLAASLLTSPVTNQVLACPLQQALSGGGLLILLLASVLTSLSPPISGRQLCLALCTALAEPMLASTHHPLSCDISRLESLSSPYQTSSLCPTASSRSSFQSTNSSVSSNRARDYLVVFIKVKNISFIFLCNRGPRRLT